MFLSVKTARHITKCTPVTRVSAQDFLRRTAFSVYSQARLLIPEYTSSVLTKSMTRFGPASAFSDILNASLEKPLTGLYKVGFIQYFRSP